MHCHSGCHAYVVSPMLNPEDALRTTHHLLFRRARNCTAEDLLKSVWDAASEGWKAATILGVEIVAHNDLHVKLENLPTRKGQTDEDVAAQESKFCCERVICMCVARQDGRPAERSSKDVFTLPTELHLISFEYCLRGTVGLFAWELHWTKVGRLSFVDFDSDVAFHRFSNLLLTSSVVMALNVVLIKCKTNISIEDTKANVTLAYEKEPISSMKKCDAFTERPRDQEACKGPVVLTCPLCNIEDIFQAFS